MKHGQDELLDFLEGQVSGVGPFVDILEKVPELTWDDAYRLQFALAKRKAAGGNRLVGYKAAYTSRAMQQDRGVAGPIIGSLMESGNFAEGRPIPLKAGIETLVEPEIAVLLGHDLAGPGVSYEQGFAAVEGVFPAIEIAEQSMGGRKRSRQMGIAIHKSNGGIVVGGPMSSPRGIDLRLEGMVISINGVVRGSATGVEVLGNPLALVSIIANKIGAFGETLKAGMILMTGSIVTAMPVVSGDDLDVEFTRIGRVRARFTG
jgi:2-keto-4-pentenoate hydratase